MFTAFTIHSHEDLGHDEVAENANRNLYVVTFTVDTNASEPCNRLDAIDQYFRNVGIMNHPDIYIEQVMDSVKTTEMYVVLNMDLD